VDEKGYARFAVGKSNLTAHRIAYELAFGKLASQDKVYHTCSARNCVNPAHLSLGKSKIPKGRPGLSSSKKENIRQKRKDGASLKELAQEFGVSIGRISQIMKEK
jgi:hypothetical protein